jgi:hypothetical protein
MSGIAQDIPQKIAAKTERLEIKGLDQRSLNDACHSDWHSVKTAAPVSVMRIEKLK